MRKNLGAKPYTYPQPVFIVAAYSPDGTPDATPPGVASATPPSCPCAWAQGTRPPKTFWGARPLPSAWRTPPMWRSATIWTGFYLLEGSTLVLGSFQGKPACIGIPVGRGCWCADWTPARGSHSNAFSSEIGYALR